MITAFIVISSLLLAGAFAFAWATRPDLRRRIERPKHLFAAQVQQYDKDLRSTDSPDRGDVRDHE